MISNSNSHLLTKLLVVELAVTGLVLFTLHYDIIELFPGFVASINQSGFESVLAFLILTLLFTRLAGLFGLYRKKNWGFWLFLFSTLLAQVTSLSYGYQDIAMVGTAPNIANHIWGSGFGWPILDGAVLAVAWINRPPKAHLLSVNYGTLR